MRKDPPAVTILIHRDGDVDSLNFRVPLWIVRSGLVAAGILSLAIVVGAILYVPMLGVAAQVPGLKSEISTLRRENAQISRLVSTVDSLESQYSKVRGMLGADVGDTAEIAAPAVVAPPIIVLSRKDVWFSSDSTIPGRWPLDEPGYITRGQLGAGDDAGHSGLDIAIPEGSTVRASGEGTVSEAAQDHEYGLYVLVKHAEGYESRYAHLSRIIVNVGKMVQSGEVIGLSGNSGRSSAPHLHFEIRRKGQSIDPLTLVKEGR
jgi:murein DD-endopeptidase MepM/ murein hydrolase activator NlpD